MLTGGVVAFLSAYGIFAFVGPSVPVLLVAFVLAGIEIGCVETGGTRSGRRRGSC